MDMFTKITEIVLVISSIVLAFGQQYSEATFLLVAAIYVRNYDATQNSTLPQTE